MWNRRLKQQVKELKKEVRGIEVSLWQLRNPHFKHGEKVIITDVDGLPVGVVSTVEFIDEELDWSYISGRGIYKVNFMYWKYTVIVGNNIYTTRHVKAYEPKKKRK